MNERPDPDWERTLAQSANVRRAYRDATQAQTPPADIDAAILAAAKRHVHAKPHSTNGGLLDRWRVPLSMAAVVVLASSLSLLFYQDKSQIATVPELPPAPAAAPVDKMVTPDQPLERRGPLSSHDEADVEKPLAKEKSIASESKATKPAQVRKRDVEPRQQSAPELSAGAPPTQPDRAAEIVRPQSQPSGASSAAANEPIKDAEVPQREKSSQQPAIAEESRNAGSVVLESEAKLARRDALQEKAEPESKVVPSKPAVASETSVPKAESPSAQAISQAPAQPGGIVAPRAAASPPASAVSDSSVLQNLARKKQAFSGTSGRDALTPEVWIKRIQDLWEQGKRSEATAEYREFLRKHPNFALPEGFPVPKPTLEDQ